MNEEQDEALLELLRKLAARDYRFVTITPASHARVVARAGRAQARTIADVFGWSLPFAPGLIQCDLRDDMREAGIVDESAPLHRSLIRVSSVGEQLFLHSAYPTSSEHAVFLGPDTYRFADAIRAALQERELGRDARILDIGTGAGVGAILAASLSPGARATATDINPAALRLARINAAAAGVTLDTRLTDGAAGLDGAYDLILVNPPYLSDDASRAYRDGGGRHGAELPLRLVTEALPHLAAGGRLLLYTGSAIVNGRDALGAAVHAAAGAAGCTLRYRETDPDVFGEELERPAYADVDRIALIVAIITRPALDPPGA